MPDLFFKFNVWYIHLVNISIFFFLQDKLAVDYKTYVLQSTEPELTRISQEMEMSSADLVFWFSFTQTPKLSLFISLFYLFHDFIVTLFFVAFVPFDIEWSLDSYMHQLLGQGSSGAWSRNTCVWICAPLQFTETCRR